MKKLIVLAVVLAVLVVGTFAFLKFNPPLVISTLVSDNERPSVIVSVGNKGWTDIQLLDVAVNDHETPTEAKVQMSNAPQGFTLLDDFQGQLAKEYGVVDIGEAIIKTGTDHATTWAKQDNGTATEEDEIYGISINHDEDIHTVHIKYSYFGISLFEEVEMPF